VSPRVVVYSSRYCGWCSRLLLLLSQKGVEPDVRVVDADRELRREMEERSGRRTVPQVFVGDHHLGGYDDLRALESAGKLDALLGTGCTETSVTEQQTT
jgi:glutaredoxin 3